MTAHPPLRLNEDAPGACTQTSHAAIETTVVLPGAPLWFQDWNEQQFQPSVAALHRDLATSGHLVRTPPFHNGEIRNAKLGDLGPSYKVTFPDETPVRTPPVRDGQPRHTKLGDLGPSYKVPFPDGQSYWEAYVAVPGYGGFVLASLTDASKLQSLSPPELYGYYTIYFPDQPVPDSLADRIVQIAAAMARRPKSDCKTE